MSETDMQEKTFGDVYSKFGHEKRQGNYLFQKIVQRGKIDNVSQKELNNARDWFRNEAMKQKSVSQKRMMATSKDFELMDRLSINSIGKMYMFSYDPKFKKTLPYYDVWPLIFPIEFYGDSMLGINFHYLPPIQRAKLMDALYELINNEKMNKTTKLKITYQILKSLTNASAFKPCIKKYLFSHVKSPFQYIKPEFWDYSLMLPTAKFIKAPQEQVWADSMRKI